MVLVAVDAADTDLNQRAVLQRGLGRSLNLDHIRIVGLAEVQQFESFQCAARFEFGARRIRTCAAIAQTLLGDIFLVGALDEVGRDLVDRITIDRARRAAGFQDRREVAGEEHGALRIAADAH